MQVSTPLLLPDGSETTEFGNGARVPGLRMIGTAREKAGVISFVVDCFRTEKIGDYARAETLLSKGSGQRGIGTPGRPSKIRPPHVVPIAQTRATLGTRFKYVRAIG